jgi:hypothetical protein
VKRQFPVALPFKPSGIHCGDGMEKLKRDLERHKKKKPIIRYDKKKKHISVTYGFNCGFIPNVKIIADRDLWLKWFYDFEQVTFDNIKPYLSRPSKKTLEALKQYVKEDPQGFTGEMLDCIQFALTENPLYPPATKTRKSEYGLPWPDKNEIINTAIRLHDYLYEIRNQKTIDWPDYLKKFLKDYGIEKYHLPDIKNVVREIMLIHYGPDFKDRFWQTFIIEGPISLKQVRKISPNPNPENDDFLKKLFENYL